MAEVVELESDVNTTMRVKAVIIMNHVIRVSIVMVGCVSIVLTMDVKDVAKNSLLNVSFFYYSGI